MSETNIIEYKTTWKDDFLKVICAFANSEGGTLFIGMDDHGKPVGLKNEKKLLEDLPNKINSKLGIVAEVKPEAKKGNNVISIKVMPSSVPISWQGRYFQRSGSVVLELNGKQLSDFLLKKSGLTWDAIEMEGVGTEGLDTDTIDKFKVLATDRLPLISAERSLSSLLDKLNLRKDGQLKRAAVLLFGKNVPRTFPQAHLKIGRFLSETEIIGSDIIEGNLFQQLEGAFEVLRKKYLINRFKMEGIHRRELPDFPLEALREALINALIHRDYNSTAATQIRVYSNKIVIMNDGRLPDELTLEDLKKSHLSIPRNYLLCDIFYKAGMIESWGSGTLKIIRLCEEDGLPQPEFWQSGGGFGIDFKSKIINDELNDELNKGQKVVVMCIQQNPGIKAKTISEKAEIPFGTVDRHIRVLLKRNLIERRGSKKTGGYYVL